MRQTLCSAGILAMACSALWSGSTHADWTQFRGTDTTGVAADQKLPASFEGKDNIAWQTDLPGRGLSSPIIVGDRVYLTASSGAEQDRLHVLCFDAESGKQIWERQFWSTGNTTCHPKTCMAAPTPASDGKNIYAFYSTNDLICLDLDGNLKWLRGLTSDYPNASNSVGMSSSPIVIDDTVIVQVESQSDAFVAGIDTATGENRWKMPRDRSPNWTSPILLPIGDNKNAVLLQASSGLVACEPKTGEVIWSLDTKCSSIPSAVVAGSVVFAPADGLTALELVEGKQPKVLWSEKRLGPSTPSPIVDNGRVYIVNGAGVLNCADAKTGEILWRLRLKGPYSSSPVAAGGLLYFVNEDGQVQVVEPGDKEGKLLSTGELGQMVLCTPAVSGNAMFLRSDKRLWKLAKDS